MNKAEFLEKLRAGLSEVPADERVAALQYYTEYLDDAGPDREAEVLVELGSPEEVAAMVRAESEADGWVPPEKNPAAQGRQAGGEAAAPSLEMPGEARAAEAPPPTEAAFGMGAAPEAPPPPGSQPPPQGGWAGQNPPPHGYGSPGGAPQGSPPPFGGGQAAAGKNQNKTALTVVLIVLGVLFAPALLGLAGGLLGTLAGLLVSLLCILIVPLIVGISLVAGGILAIVVGTFGFSISLPTGLASVGVGILILGLGLLCCYGGVRLLAKVVPAVFRGLAALFRKIFRREKKAAPQT